MAETAPERVFSGGEVLYSVFINLVRGDCPIGEV